MLPQRSGAVFTEYVREGGALVAEARAGWNNERGFASEIIPGMGLHEVFGAREVSVQSPPGMKVPIEWGTRRLTARVYEEVLQPLRPDARIVAKFPSGQPAAVEATFGKGKTIAIGSYLGAAYERDRDPQLRDFFISLLAWAGVEKPFDVEGEVEVRMLESGRQRILIAMNHSTKAAKVTVKGFKAALNLVSDAKADFTNEIGPHDIWALRLE
jgi:beta-galactosidase